MLCISLLCGVAKQDSGNSGDIDKDGACQIGLPT